MSLNVIKIALSNDAKSIDINISTNNLLDKIISIEIKNYNDDEVIYFNSNLNVDDFNQNINTFIDKPVGFVLKGLFYVQIKIENSETENISYKTYPIANLSKYYTCVLNILNQLEIQGCGEVVSKRCDDCNKDFLLIDSLLQGVYLSSANFEYKQAKAFIDKLDNVCDICNGCPDTSDNLLPIGIVTFGVYNNIINYGNQ